MVALLLAALSSASAYLMGICGSHTTVSCFHLLRCPEDIKAQGYGSENSATSASLTSNIGRTLVGRLFWWLVGWQLFHFLWIYWGAGWCGSYIDAIH